MPNTPKKTVLLVEDNPDDEALTLRAFDKHHFSSAVVVARSGVEALDYLFATGAYAERDISDQPQVVLLDLNLPQIGGLEVLRRLRADDRTRTLPVVVLTSSREERDLVDSYRFGCNSYVRKPVNFDEFLEATLQLGVYWLVLNEVPLQR
jgi:two-component system, response regulator